MRTVLRRLRERYAAILGGLQSDKEFDLVLRLTLLYHLHVSSSNGGDSTDEAGIDVI